MTAANVTRVESTIVRVVDDAMPINLDSCRMIVVVVIDAFSCRQSLFYLALDAGSVDLHMSLCENQRGDLVG